MFTELIEGYESFYSFNGDYGDVLFNSALLYIINSAIIISSFALVYWIYYSEKTRHYFQEYKLQKDKFPPPRLIRKEFTRTLFNSCLAETFYYAIYLWGLGSGMISFRNDSYTWTDVLAIPLLILWADTHFYLFHRAFHFQPFYKWIHHVHHESVNTNPWSALSFHIIESFVYFSALAPLWYFPSLHKNNYYGLRFGLIYGPLSGHLGYAHSGFIGSPIHNAHHIKKNVNYGAWEPSPWDWWFGSVDWGE